MIIRRLITGLRQQDWTTVAIELLIVVAGVFIGIQVSNWNEARTERAQAALIRSDIVDDLTADIEEIEQVLRQANRRFNASNVLLTRAIGWEAASTFTRIDGRQRSLEVPDNDHQWSAQQALVYSDDFNTFDADRRTYDGLVTSSNILMLKNPSLIAALRQHYNKVKGRNDVEDKHFRRTVARVRDELSKIGIGPLDDLSWDELALLIRESPSLIGALKRNAVDALKHRRYMLLMKADTEEMIAFIQGEDHASKAQSM